MIKKVINVLSVVVLVFLVIFVLFTLASRIMGNTPSVFGFYIFRVSSDSMEPTLMVGDVILVQKADAEDIQKNDIITYKSRDGSMYGRDVTHRVVAEPFEKNGTYHYQTQGDADGAPLDKAITYEQVEGKYVRTLNVIGKVYGFICTPVGVCVFIGVIVLLFGYELISMLVSFKKMDEVELEPSEKDKSTGQKKDPKVDHQK